MGTYADSLLAQGEVVLLRRRQHWLALLLDSRIALALWAIALVLVIVYLFFGFRWENTSGQVLLGLILIVVVAGLANLVWRWWHWQTEEYIVTNRRLMKVSGIINKRSGDSSLEKINDAILEENLLGRMLNYGDLDILTAAEAAVDRYRMLNHAKDFKKAMLAAKHELEQGMGGADLFPPAPRMTPGPPITTPPEGGARQPAPNAIDTPEEVTDALARLATLRDAGHITPQEYESKKQELLGRL